MLGLIMEDGTKSRPPFLAMGSSASVMWNRDFGQERFKSLQQRWKACMDVEGMLTLLGARQLIIGHTPQVGCRFSIASVTVQCHGGAQWQEVQDASFAELVPHAALQICLRAQEVHWILDLRAVSCTP